MPVTRSRRLLLALGIGLVLIGAALLAGVLAAKATAGGAVFAWGAGALTGAGITCVVDALVD